MTSITRRKAISKQIENHWLSIDLLYEHFKNYDGAYWPRTWTQLRKARWTRDSFLLGIAESSLSRMLRELIPEFISAELHISEKGKRETVYKVLKEWTLQIRVPQIHAWFENPDGNITDLGEYRDFQPIERQRLKYRRGKINIRMAPKEEELMKERLIGRTIPTPTELAMYRFKFLCERPRRRAELIRKAQPKRSE